MTVVNRKFVEELLNFIEEREVNLLSWGFYDGSSTALELENEIANSNNLSLQDNIQDAQNDHWPLTRLLDEASYNGLLYRIQAPGQDYRYRSRFAEGVRLIGRLKQRFSHDDWQAAPNLVSDLKVDLRPRSYPDFNQPAERCWDDLKQYVLSPKKLKDVFDALTSTGDGKKMPFAGFQRRSFTRVLKNYKQSNLSGTVVCAGTGSGKTKSFYIPALLGVAGDLLSDQSPFTKVIAVYPRNILLTDQLREAVSETLKLRPFLEKNNSRMITLGAFAGITPFKSWLNPQPPGKKDWGKINGWRRASQGLITPLLKSPNDGVSDLIWKDDDRKAGRSCLYRADSLQPDVPDGVLVLTREDIIATPPDILFLSVDMLNREMGSSDWQRAFGLSEGPKPRLLLLDEVHSYAGLQGAQIGWVLRRWLKWRREKALHVVGLSATLKDAPNHLSRLTGMPADKIEAIEPSSDELIEEGKQYSIAIKGDPISGPGLLSTTIQTVMLTSRLLTPSGSSSGNSSNPFDQEYFFGKKLFCFTDTLDVVNRWFSNLVDAETRRRLSKYRLDQVNGTTVSDQFLRESEGQLWRLTETIGHDLNDSQKISRCSSQDPGANVSSDIIVATSALEVGFDDPEVGGTIHHKRPISMSSFLQRKGRAGRRRGMRPMTINIFSDYGSDMWAFQFAENIFSPEIDQILLPILNPFVLKVHATYFLIDWLGQKIGTGRPFDYLSNKTFIPPGTPATRDKIVKILVDILVFGPAYDEFVSELKALFLNPFGNSEHRLSEDDINALLWEPPRPLLLEVIPALLRKLEKNWQIANLSSKNDQEDKFISRPLPSFLPTFTSQTLDLTGCEILLPAPDKEQENLSAGMTLIETCPGKVSKRYVTNTNAPGYWHEFSNELLSENFDPTDAIDVTRIYPSSLEVDFINGTNIYQPYSVSLVERENNVKDSANSNFNWEFFGKLVGNGEDLGLCGIFPWDDVFVSSRAFLHRSQSGIFVTRYASEFEYEITRERRDTIIGIGQFGKSNGGKQAVGFQQEVDGLVFGIRAEHIDQTPTFSDETISRLRFEYFMHCVVNDPLLRQNNNKFRLDWLAQSSLAMLCATALTTRKSLSEAQKLLVGKRPQSARAALERIFFVAEIDDDDTHGAPNSRLFDAIIDLWSDPKICTQMEVLEQVLWQTQGSEFQQWLRERYVATLAQALRKAVIGDLEDVSLDDLYLDLHWQEDKKQVDVFITEMSQGGLGQIELIVEYLRENPDSFHKNLRLELTQCPRDLISSNLLEAIKSVLRDDQGELGLAFKKVRTAFSLSDTDNARTEIIGSLWNAGIFPTRRLIVALVSKFLQRGTSQTSDKLIYFLNRAFEKQASTLGVFVDNRVFAYICMQITPVHRRLGNFLKNINTDVTEGQIFAILQRFLLQRCNDACPECLEQRTRYSNLPKASRELAAHWVNVRPPTVAVERGDINWSQKFRNQLFEKGAVRLCIDLDISEDVTAYLFRVLAEDFPVDDLLKPITLTSVEKLGGSWAVSLRIDGFEGKNSIFEQSDPSSTLPRDIWSAGRGQQLRNLLQSVFALQMVNSKPEDYFYIVSPWVSDFDLLENLHDEFSPFFPSLGETKNILLSDYLNELSRRTSVRIITVSNDTSNKFAKLLASKAPKAEIRFASNNEHEKGILSPTFYIEGSMNVTFFGVNIRGEKITYHAKQTLGGAEKMARAQLEFERHWNNLKK
jgi:hypothetical protein